MKSIWVFVGVLALSVPVLPAFAEPFGLNKGDSLQKLKSRGIKLTPVSTPYTYKTDSLPQGSTLFNDYWLWITPQAGLCSITAWTPGIDDDPYGSNTQTQYQFIYVALTKKYGSSKKFDFLKANAIWTDSREWMMALFKNDRVLSTFWDREENSNLPRELRAIQLKAIASTGSRSLISVSYDYSNLDSCKKEKINANTGNL